MADEHGPAHNRKSWGQRKTRRVHKGTRREGFERAGASAKGAAVQQIPGR
jgi:hypothetical protein